MLPIKYCKYYILFFSIHTLDIGCGCGAQGIAAMKVGSKLPVTFNDIDFDALEAVELNCQANGIPRSSYLLDNTNLLERRS